MPYRKPKPWGRTKPPVGFVLDYGNPISQGVVLRLLMNEGGGTRLNDASGRNHTAVQTGTGSSWKPGKFGCSMLYPGTNNNCSVVSNSNDLRPSKITIISWIYRTSTAADQNALVLPFANVSAPSFISYSLKPYEVSNATAVMEIGVSGDIAKQGIEAYIKNNVWQQWAMTADGTTWKGYIDGVQVFSVSAAGPVYSGTDDLYVGTGTQTINPFLGGMDNITIANRILTPQEIAYLFTNPFADILAPRRRIISQVTATGIAFDAASNSGTQTAQSTYTFARTITGSNTFLGIDVSILSVGATVTSIIDNYDVAPVNLSFIGSQATVTALGSVECWGLAGAVTGTKNVQVNLSGSLTSVALGASYTGVHQTLPTEAFNSAQATNVGAADATVNITTVADNDWVHVAVVVNDDAITPNQTGRNNVSFAAVGSGANEDNNAAKTPAGSVTMSYTGVGALKTWAIGGYAIRPIAAAGRKGFLTLLGVG